MFSSKFFLLLNRFTFHPRYLFNRFRQGFEYLRGRTYCKAFPNFIILELSNLCNLECIICPYPKMQRPKGNMEFSLFRKIIAQVKGYVEVVDLDCYGEFSFNPQWAEMIAYAKQQGLFTVLNTNATLFTDELLEKLVNSGLDVLTMSFDGASKEVYERIRKGAVYEKTLNNIMNYLKKNRSIYSIIQLVRTTETQNEVKNFRRMWKNKGFEVVRIKEYTPNDPDKGFLDPRHYNPLTSKPKPCLFLWKSLVICQDGAIVPCGVDYDKKYILGDAKTQDILDVWNSEPMQRLRGWHIRGDYQKVELCSRCCPLNVHPILLSLSSFADDSIRRKLFPFFG
jgi:radical SAM protein with 4Fe4S-binding SPASM domain